MNLTKINSIKNAIFYTLIAAIAFSLTTFFVKIAANDTNNTTIVFFRFLISFVYIFAIFIFKKNGTHKIILKTKNFKLHFFHFLSAILAMALFYYSIKFLPLLTGSLLFMANPLFVPLLLLFFQNMRTPKSAIAAIILGFIGVVLVLQPLSFFKNINHFATIIALLSAIAAACGFIFINKLSRVDHINTILFYYFLMGTVASGIAASLSFSILNLKTFFALIAIGIFGTIYQKFITHASTFASSRLIASLMYITVILNGFFDWFFWRVQPFGVIEISGVILIIIGSIFTIIFTRHLQDHKESKI